MQEDIHRQFGKGRHLAVGVDPRFREAFLHVARADVEADRQVAFDRDIP